MSERRGPNRWFFDLWSRFYDARAIQRLTYHPVHDAVVRALGASDARRVLDVGCGTGQLARRLHRTLGAQEVVGCDFSRGMLARAQARDREVRWVQGDALRLPFRDGSFGAVVSTEAFHWFPDQQAALAEFRRVLEPKGRLLLALVNPPFETLSQLTNTGSRLLNEPLYWPTQEQMQRQVETAGFRVEGQRRVFRAPSIVFFPTVLTVGVRDE